MRSGITIVMTFLCCFLVVVGIMTIGSYILQKDEMEKSVAFATEDAVRYCVENNVNSEEQIADIVRNKLIDQIKSKRGTIDLYVLYANKDLIDVAVTLKYNQYNHSDKTITKRVTVIRDWEEGKENKADVRLISAKYFVKAPEMGGLKTNSVWRKDTILNEVLNNKQKSDGTWLQYKFLYHIQ